jgi:bacillithiol biosynthesis cysteine-adding enzyme BshC
VPASAHDAAPRSLADAYRNGDLRSLWPVAAGDVASALEAPRPGDRRALVDALRASALRWGLTPAQEASLQRLENPHSRVVVAGQQVGWMLGPVFTLSKAISAIALARQLHSEARPVVPIFWMATQDHDVAEIDHAWLLGRNETLTRQSVPFPVGPAVGRMRFDPAWATQLEDALRAADTVDGRPGPHLDAVLELWRDACGGAERWSDVFARLLKALLGDQGLLVVDPLDPRVAALWSPLLARELEDPEWTAEAVRRGGEALQALGYAPQLGRAAGASNLFVEWEPGAARALLRRDAGVWRVGDRAVSLADVKARLADDPTAVTPAAGLRPVLQDSLLPTAAFVVGPGELRYLAQLRDVYGHHGVAQPLLWPRVSVTVLQPPVRRILERYGLPPAAARDDLLHLQHRIALDLQGHAGRFSAALATLEREGATLVAEVEAIDPTLVRSVLKGRRHFERTVLGLREKASAALARRDTHLSRQFERLQVHLRPNGGLQERVLTPFSFFLTLGVKPVMNAFASLPAEGHELLVF